VDRDTVISPATYDVKGNCCADLRNLTDALQILETSHISVAKPRTDDDGLLPAGRQMPADWHFDANLSCEGKIANDENESVPKIGGQVE
jgi:hypothetical protein